MDRFGDREKKNKARQDLTEKARQRALSGIVDLEGVGVNTLEIPNILGQTFDTEIPIQENEEEVEISDDLSTWVDPKKQSFFQYLQNPEKPEYNQERADKLKKVAIANSIGQALGSIHKLGLRNNGGIAGDDINPTGNFIMSEIDFLDDQYLRDVANYDKQLQATQMYNNQLVNKEAELSLQEAQRLSNMQADLAVLQSKQKLTKEEAQKERDLRWRIAHLDKALKERGYDLESERYSNINFTNQKDLLNNQGRKLTDRRGQLIKQLSESIDDNESMAIRQEIAMIDNELKAVNDAYAELTGARYTAPQSKFNGPYAPEQGFDPNRIEGQARPGQPSRSQQINQVVSDEPEKPAGKKEEAKSFFNQAIEEALQQGYIKRSQMRTLEQAAKDAGYNLSQDELKTLLENEYSIEISYNPLTEKNQTLASR